MTRPAFDARTVIEAKVAVINAYFARCCLDAAVVGVSGGVDSAVAIGLVSAASRAFGSPIRRVIAALIPVPCDGATAQDDALARGRLVAAWASAEAREIPLGAAHAAMRDAIGPLTPWASGQLVSVLRTPALYALTAQVADQGGRAVVVGTTNRDEGAYLGFFGKASDGMVDVQPIADLHKSEVYAIARALGVPPAVLEATPSGDVFDGRVDVEMIGASYDEVEAVLAAKAAGRSSADAGVRAEAVSAIEALHAHNAHKYAVGAPSVFLDVLERAVPGGWSVPTRPPPPPPPAREDGVAGPFVGRFAPRPAVAVASAPRSAMREAIGDLGPAGFVARGLLDRVPDLAGVDWVPVGSDGRPRPDDAAPIGSWRATSIDPVLADALWERLRPLLPCCRVFGHDDATDHGDLAGTGERGRPEVWRPIGLNPVLRWIRYVRGGHLVPHYDAAHDFGDGLHRTLSSVLVSVDGRGATRLLVDGQRHLPVAWRQFDDASAAKVAHGVLARVALGAGDALVLDHRVLHEAEPWSGPGDRLVLRTDVVWQRCAVVGEGLGPSRPEVDAAAATARAGGSGEQRRRWRVARDPYVGPAFLRIGEDAVGPSGFFDDGAQDLVDDREGADWWVTPPPPLPPGGLDPDRWPCVVLCTGSYCPPHAGHVAMFDRAREALEARGAQVIAGYLSVGHDDYVLRKVPDGPVAAERIALCEALVADVPWLRVCPWESLHAPVALNYTDVVARLERVMSRYVRSHRPVRVAYVAGGDNAGFALSFAARGHCVIVGRPGSEEAVRRVASHPAIAGNPRIAVVSGDRPEASRTIRAATPRAVPTRRSWVLQVRDEGPWAVSHWLGAPAREGETARAWSTFCDRAVSALVEAFDRGGVDLTVKRIELREQRRRLVELERMARERSAVLVSLDPCLPAQHNLEFSRRFALASVAGPMGRTERPGAASVAEQLAGLHGNHVILVDDDTATGGTLDWVRAHLPQRVVVDSVALTTVLEGDLLDLRDLLVGSREGGLVVALPPRDVAMHAPADGRVPYVLPYARPSARFGLPPAQEIALSRAIWTLMAEFFTACPRRVDEAWAASREALQAVGFSERTPLADVCAWHVARLRGPTARA